MSKKSKKDNDNDSGVDEVPVQPTVRTSAPRKRYIIEGGGNFPTMAPGSSRGQTAVYDTKTRQVAAIFPSASAATAWAEEQNKKVKSHTVHARRP